MRNIRRNLFFTMVCKTVGHASCLGIALPVLRSFISPKFAAAAMGLSFVSVRRHDRSENGQQNCQYWHHCVAISMTRCFRGSFYKRLTFQLVEPVGQMDAAESPARVLHGFGPFSA